MTISGLGKITSGFSICCSMLFLIVPDVLFTKIRSECQEKLPYADDLTLVSDSLDGIKAKLEMWKGGLESKRLRVKIGRQKL